jgi:hypothetical protein
MADRKTGQSAKAGWPCSRSTPSTSNSSTVKAFVFSQAVDELGRVFAQMKTPDQSGLSYNRQFYGRRR